MLSWGLYKKDITWDQRCCPCKEAPVFWSINWTAAVFHLLNTLATLWLWAASENKDQVYQLTETSAPWTNGTGITDCSTVAPSGAYLSFKTTDDWCVSRVNSVTSDLSLWWLVIAFHFLSFVFQATAMMQWDFFCCGLHCTRENYTDEVDKHGTNVLRMIEYSISATLMQIAIALVLGIWQRLVIMGVAFLTVVTMLLGLVAEQLNALSKSYGSYMDIQVELEQHAELEQQSLLEKRSGLKVQVDSVLMDLQGRHSKVQKALSEQWEEFKGMLSRPGQQQDVQKALSGEQVKFETQMQALLVEQTQLENRAREALLEQRRQMGLLEEHVLFVQYVMKTLAWVAHFIGWLSMGGAWVILGRQFYYTIQSSETTPPGFVYVIVGVIGILYTGFGVIQLVQLCLPGNENSPNWNRAVETAYTINSLTSKSFLGWIIFANALGGMAQS